MDNQAHSTLWEQYQQAVSVAAKQSNFGKAARLLKEAFREAEEYGELPPGLIAQASALAELHLNHFRYRDAETVLRIVLELREKLLGQAHSDVLESLKQLAIVQIMSFRAEALGRQHTRSPMPWSDMIAAAS